VNQQAEEGEEMNMNPKRGCALIPWLAAAISLLLFRPGMVFAASAEGSQLSVTLNAGETYVINNVSPNATPGVKVVNNPHALVVHNEEPGKVVLLGAEKGNWAITVKDANGNDVTYNVTVNAAANPADINKPSAAPPAISGTGAKSGSAAPVVTKLDAGAGPVASSSPAAAASPSITASAAEAPSETVAPAGAAAPRAAEMAAASASAPAAAPSPASAPVMPNQSASGEKFRTDPSVALSGGNYDSTAVNGGVHYLPPDTVMLMMGTSRIIDFPDRIRRVSVADTNIADIQVVNPFQLNLIAHKAGFTTLAVWNAQGGYQERQIRVDTGGKQQVLLNTMIAELNRQAIENQGVNLSAALPNYGVSLVGLPGAVATPYSPNTNVTAVLPNGTVLQGGSASLPPPGALIPMLLSQNVTYGLSAGNSNMQWQGFFQFLENHNLGKVLAEPHLLANSGEQAKFMSGGEIPIVIAQALNTSIVFKEFGTMVEFLPTVVGRDQIELVVKPEVSEPDYTHGVQMFGFTIPAFVTRKADTMVRLHDNQTLIIAGLILHQRTAAVNKVPYLGDVPFLGGLFRTTNWQNTETDLVMSVTPQIVRPLPDGSSVYNPYQTPEMTPAQVKTMPLAHPDAARPRF
jgi:Flp pilus assembly secretin CpaC